MKLRTEIWALGALLAVSLLSGCMSNARRQIEDARVKAHAEPLELSGAKGAPKALIGTDGGLTVGGQAIALSPSQQAATLAYRQASLQVVDVSLKSASEYVRFAVPRMLFDMVIHGGPDGAARSMEKSGEHIVYTPQFCNALENMREKQDVMVTDVARLRPYAQLAPIDVQDCRAGRPFKHSI